MRRDNAEIELNESVISPVAHVGSPGRIVSDAAETFGASSQHAIKIDRFEIGLRRTGDQGILLDVEVKNGGFQIENAALKFGVIGNWKCAHKSEPQDEVR